MSSLHKWQTELVEALQCDHVRTRGRGYAVTRDVQLWWRATRLRERMPWTIDLVRRTSTGVIAEYLDETYCPSLFFLPEARQFRDYLAQRVGLPPVLVALARFEVGLLDARDCARSGEGRGDVIVAFPCDPVVLLGELIGVEIDSPASTSWMIRLSPSLPRLWEVLDRDAAQRLGAGGPAPSR